LHTSADRIVAGESVTVSGALECMSGASTTEQQIAVYQQRRGAGAGPDSANLAGIATTQIDGSYELTSTALYANTVFRARVGRRGARAIVKVAPIVTLNAPSPPGSQPLEASRASHPLARRRVTFTGTVSPTDPGARVALQVAYPGSDGHWRPVAFGRIGSDGSYSIAHAFGLAGEANVRAIVHPGRHNAAGISEEVSYAVSQPQNPQLTIYSSANPISYGQLVTISGVAGAPNQPVALLARTGRGAFTVVARSTANPDGDYAFTQEPIENTSYAVTDASARSATLLEGVRFNLVTAAAEATAQVGQRSTFSGTLTGAPEGQLVYLERGRKSGLGFRVVSMGRVDASSHYRIAYTFNRPGANVLRIKVHGDTKHRQSTGALFTVTVTNQLR
jgi:hypothetical protein